MQELFYKHHEEKYRREPAQVSYLDARRTGAAPSGSQPVRRKLATNLSGIPILDATENSSEVSLHDEVQKHQGPEHERFSKQLQRDQYRPGARGDSAAQ